MSSTIILSTAVAEVDNSVLRVIVEDLVHVGKTFLVERNDVQAL